MENSTSDVSADIARVYGHRVRVRVCGLCWEGDKLLMVKHKMQDHRAFWSPPGGGVEFGQSLEDNLVREFLEETTLNVRALGFRFVCEYIAPPLHALEVFMDVAVTGGTVQTGFDPELAIIESVAYLDWPTIMALPNDQRHGIFRQADTPEKLRNLHGLYRI